MARRRRLFRYYEQFEGLSEEEVNAQLREDAAQRRRHALARVEPLDLSRTTWPEYPHPAIVNAITFAARRGLHRYLDRGGSDLRSELAHRHGVPEQRIVIGDGSAQLLSSAASALLGPGDEVVTPWPSYRLYPQMARRAHADAVLVPSLPGLATTRALAAVNDRTRLVVLCNPNDPTGELVGVAELRRLLEELPERVVVLLDEALRDFADVEPHDATLALLEDFPRVLAFRTFSKAWGLAGLRCGYVVGGPGAEELLGELAPGLGVNELAQAGALEALRTTAGIVEQRRVRIAGHRAHLEAVLRERCVDVPPSQANVLWLAAPGPRGGAALSDSLQRAGVLVAPGGPLGSIDRVRVTVPHRPEDVERLIGALNVVSG
jgi:histidinol-phosphate aminotransferase